MLNFIEEFKQYYPRRIEIGGFLYCFKAVGFELHSKRELMDVRVYDAKILEERDPKTMEEIWEEAKKHLYDAFPNFNGEWNDNDIRQFIWDYYQIESFVFPNLIMVGNKYNNPDSIAILTLAIEGLMMKVDKACGYVGHGSKNEKLKLASYMIYTLASNEREKIDIDYEAAVDLFRKLQIEGNDEDNE